jgi:hypothetical protein
MQHNAACYEGFERRAERLTRRGLAEQRSPQLIDAGGVVGDTRKRCEISLQSAEGQGRGRTFFWPGLSQPVGLGGRYGRFDAGEIIPHRIMVL